MLSLEDAAACLRRGGLVAMPTETVYGLGADAFNALAVAGIFNAKGRPRFDPLIVHIAESSALDHLARTVPPQARKLAARFWPGALTLVLPKQAAVPDLVTAGLDTVAVRLPAHPLAQALIRKTGSPLAAPSANRFGRLSPTTAEAVLEQLGERIDGVLDGGACEIGIESTIIGFWAGRRLLLRPGGISREAIEACIGTLEVFQAGQDRSIPAPGLLPRHYAPQTPLVLRPSASPVPAGRIGHLTFGSTPDAYDAALTLNLDPGGDLCRAAANLYRMLRRLDHAALDGIVADRVPDTGLGLAINDRLERAARR